MIHTVQADDWIPLRKAASRLSPLAGGDLQAKQMIADRLRDLEFTACAEIIAEGIDIGAVGSTPPSVSKTKIGTGYAREVLGKLGLVSVLGPAFWRSSSDWEADLKRWDWGLGIVILSRKPPYKTLGSQADIPVERRFNHRSVAYNVRIKRSDVDALVKPDGHPEIQALSKAPPKPALSSKYDWEALLIELIVIADYDGLDDFGNPSIRGDQKKLEDWLKNKMAALCGKEPSESEVRKRASAIFAARRARSG